MDLLVAALPAFLASLVEAVEALTIILAVGVTRQWRSSLYGAFTGLLPITSTTGRDGSRPSSRTTRSNSARGRRRWNTSVCGQPVTTMRRSSTP